MVILGAYTDGIDRGMLGGVILNSCCYYWAELMKSDVNFNITIKQEQILLLIGLVQTMVMVTVTATVTTTVIATVTATVTVTVPMRVTAQRKHVHKMNLAR